MRCRCSWIDLPALPIAAGIASVPLQSREGLQDVFGCLAPGPHVRGSGRASDDLVPYRTGVSEQVVRSRSSTISSHGILLPILP